MSLPLDNPPRSDRPVRRNGKKIERLVRLAALMVLCLLVWYFSYDHGRQSVRTRVIRLEAENISLREKVILLEEEALVLKQQASVGSSEPNPCVQPSNPTSAVPRDQAQGERLTIKLAENKGAFDGAVVITLVELDSLDQEAIIRVHHRTTGRRETKLMVPGDIFEIDIEGRKHQLYLDQIKGSLTFFIVDGLPGDTKK